MKWGVLAIALTLFVLLPVAGFMVARRAVGRRRLIYGLGALGLFAAAIPAFLRGEALGFFDSKSGPLVAELKCIEERFALPGEVAHARHGSFLVLAVHPLRILAASHLQPVRRSRDAHAASG